MQRLGTIKMSLRILCVVLQNNAEKHKSTFSFGEMKLLRKLWNIYKTLSKRVFKLFLIGPRFFTRIATT